MRRLVLPPGLVVALLLAGPPAHAQGVEVGIFGGYACLVDYTGSGMFQGDVSAGVFFAF